MKLTYEEFKSNMLNQEVKPDSRYADKVPKKIEDVTYLVGEYKQELNDKPPAYFEDAKIYEPLVCKMKETMFTGEEAIKMAYEAYLKR